MFGDSHLGRYAIAEAFHGFTEIVAHDVVKEGFAYFVWFTFGVHVFKGPNWIVTRVGVFEGRFYTIDCNSGYASVFTGEVAQSHIADGTFGVFNVL